MQISDQGVAVFEQGTSAFLGALFAFVFMWMWDLIVRHRERSERHYNGVVALCHLLNEHMSAINQAQIEIAGILESHAEAAKLGQVPFFGNCPEQLGTDFGFTVDLANHDLLEDVARHRYRVLTANRDIRRYIDILERLEAAYAADRLPREEFQGHLAELMKLPRAVGRHLAMTQEKGLTLAAKARVRAKRDRPAFHRVTVRMRRTRYEKNFAKAVDRELAVLRAEIEDVQKASSEDIQQAGNTGT